ncbi:MAG: hypothetical protein R6V04_09860 [bacterium]
MPVSIKNINITNIGPLSSLTIKPAMLNLIYGKNEMGKTHVVEFLIHSLFRNPKLWPSRVIKGNGKITIEGLKNDPVSFSPRSKKKIEDYLEEKQAGLPTDFSRLLIIRGAEAGLRERDDKQFKGQVVTKSILKNFLSSQELLSHIAQGLPLTVNKIRITNSTISGDERATEIKRKNSLSRKLRDINQLIDQIDNIYSGGNRTILNTQKNQLIQERDLQIKAKRYLAYTISKDIGELENQKSKISETRLQQARELLTLFKQNNERYKNLKIEKERHESNCNHYNWVSNACEEYEQLLNQETNKPNILFLIFALLSLISAGIFAYLQMFLEVIVSLVAVLLFGALYLKKFHHLAKIASENREMKKIETAFKSKFNEDMTGLASLKEKSNTLKEHYDKAKILHEQLSAEKNTLVEQKIKLNDLITALVGRTVSPQNWEKTLQNLSEQRRQIDQKIKEKNNELNLYGVKSSDYVKDKPEMEYNQDQLETVIQEIESIQEKLNQEDKKLKNLEHSIYSETDKNTANNWEDLIQNLKEKKEKVTYEYKQITAEIIGKVLVHRVLEKFQKDEDKKIIEGLQSTDVLEPLQNITKRYHSLGINGEQLIISDKFNDFIFSDLSTGAQEQVLLSLRIGFSQKLLNKDTLFLIFDDAFQYSDWERREFLVDQMVKISKLGWQVIYLTMDDHIKSLFEKMGKQLGQDFKTFNLNNN